MLIFLYYKERKRNLKIQTAYIHRMEPTLKFDMRKSQKYSPQSLTEYQSLLTTQGWSPYSSGSSQSSRPACLTKTTEILDP